MVVRPPSHVHSLPHVVAGLFAGVGGLELGLRQSGHHADLLCEIDPAASAVLAHQFSRVSRREDVRSLRTLPRDVSLLTAGFPCQDLSQAGRTEGIRGARSGLVAEVFRLLAARRIPWVILENVSFMLQLDRGRAMQLVVHELERLGYSWAYRVVDTRSFGLPQRRQRVFLVATTVADPRDVLFADDAGMPPSLRREEGYACGFYWTEGTRGLGWAVNAVPTLKGGSTVGVPSPPAIWMPKGEIVTPSIRDAERLQGFELDWTAPAESVAKRGVRWKLVGNAVSVPVAAWLGRRLLQPGESIVSQGRRIIPGSPWPRAAWNTGEGRFVAEISSWPLNSPVPLLHEFVHEVTPLSYRAAAGFLGRAKDSTLRFQAGFLEAVCEHVRQFGVFKRQEAVAS
jgi:DNA (cytosine-5)-methyltransferase 1